MTQEAPRTFSPGLDAAFCTGARAYVSPEAIAHNLARIRERLATAGNKSARVWAVLKCDAYGHSVGGALAGIGEADGIAVSALSEAFACRALGWRKPILLMAGGFQHRDLLDPSLHPLHLVIDDAQQLSELSKMDGSVRPTIWLRSRGSLGQAGFNETDYRRLHTELQHLHRSGRVGLPGHFVHFARAEDAEALQEERLAFERLTAGLPGPRCTDNSAAVLSPSSPPGHQEWVRSGIALYGASPLPDRSGPALGLRPAMTLTAPLFGTHTLCADQTLGYGGSFRASADMRIGLLRCGYADGYPRSPGTGGFVLLGGQRAAILGRVSMDTLSIDLTDLPHASIGTQFTLWGTADLPVEHVAMSAGTIAAHLLTGLTPRVPRLILPGAPGASRA